MSNASNSNARFNFKKPKAMRSRTPSPAPSLSRHSDHGEKRLSSRPSRSRSPAAAMKRLLRRSSSPAAAATMELISHHDWNNNELSAKKLRGHSHSSATKVELQHSLSSSSDMQRAPSSPQATTQLSHRNYKDYSQIDTDDPTPVKEARRLSSLFQNRITTTNHPSASLASSSPLAMTDRTPISYSKALKKSTINENALPTTAVPAIAVAVAISSPLSAMKLFQATETNTTQNSNATNASLFHGYNDPNLSETTILSTQLFSHQSGIDTANLQRLLSKSKNGGDNTKQWELRKRLDKKEEELAVVRTACADLLEGKEEFVAGAITVEGGLRNKLAEVQSVFANLTQEKCSLEKDLEEEKEENVGLKEQIQQLLRERDSYKTRCEMISSELDGTKLELGKLQQSHTENAIALALLESKLEESTSQNEMALANLANSESTHQEAIKEAEFTVAMDMGEKLSNAKTENAMLTNENKVRKAREEEICRLLHLEVALVDIAADEPRTDADGGTADAFLNSIKHRLEEFQKDVKVKGEVERDLESCFVELEKVEADYQAALETAATKDRDMSELMKSIGDIQRSGQDREQEVANQRKVAEERAAAAESQIVECREKLLSLGHEKKTLEDALESSKTVCTTHKSTIANLQKETADSKIETVQHDSLRAKAEEKSNEERAERIALAAQLNTKLQEHAQSEKQLRESMETTERSLNDHLRLKEEESKTKDAEIAACREKLLSLGYEKKSLEEVLEASEAECTAHESTISNLQKEVADSKMETVQHDSLQAKAEEKANEERTERVALAAQLNARLQEHAATEKQLRELMETTERSLTDQIRLQEEESKVKDAEIVQCKSTITVLEAHQLSLKESLSQQKSMLDASNEEEIARLKGEIANLELKFKAEVQKLHSLGVVGENKVRELEEVIRKGKAERKRMHNIIQELRGNVRVFARIRPFLPDDGKQGEEGGTTTPFVSHEGDDMVTVTKPNDPGQKHEFPFDRVFAPSAGQETVYDEVSEFVQSALDGYNVTLFSYGQTGSGKTHTMQGTGAGVMRGLIPRSIEQIGLHKSQLTKDGWSFSMEMSFLEIYNECLRDLLRDNTKEESKHAIKVGSDGRRTVTNLTIKSIDPNDRNAIEAVLALGAKRRSTASTDMNATSSRSHSVFTLHLTAKHEERNKMVRGTLNLVDLAGSERLDRSNVEGQHAKETMAINKSLSSLADVFYAIGQKQSHVPFRHSKLTYLLEPSLSGDGKTLMVVNISPTEASVQESLCSLRFASKVNKCELGKAKRTIEEVKNNNNGAAPSKRGNNTTGSKSSGAVSGRNVKRKV